MELVEGQSLRSLLGAGPLPPPARAGHHRPAAGGAGPRPRQGHRPPGHQAREHPAGEVVGVVGRLRAHRRLRAGQAAGRRLVADAGQGAGQPALHAARADARRRHRRAGGHLLHRHRAVRDADRPPAVRGVQHRGRAAGAEAAAGAAAGQGRARPADLASAGTAGTAGAGEVPRRPLPHGAGHAAGDRGAARAGPAARRAAEIRTAAGPPPHPRPAPAGPVRATRPASDRRPDAAGAAPDGGSACWIAARTLARALRKRLSA